MLKVGLTGGIGSGKSIVSKVLETLGYAVFNSDLESKRLMNHNQGLIHEITQIFGEEAYQNHELNRAYLARSVFQNPKLREQLNAIVHPATRQAFAEFCDLNHREKVVFNEAAILFETGAYKSFDKLILVTAPEELRIKRVMERDQLSMESVRERIKAQWPDSEKINLADFVLLNDDQRPLLSQIESLLSELQ